jgi:quercetin dioxygenase-like cupin family protein
MSLQTVYNLNHPAQGIPREIAEGIRGSIFVSQNAMLQVVRFEPHSATSIHSHAEEQWTLVLEGECIRSLGGVETRVQAGDFWFFPANSSHGVRTEGLPALLLDVFSPPRPEYRTTGQGFGV